VGGRGLPPTHPCPVNIKFADVEDTSGTEHDSTGYRLTALQPCKMLGTFY